MPRGPSGQNNRRRGRTAEERGRKRGPGPPPGHRAERGATERAEQEETSPPPADTRGQGATEGAGQREGPPPPGQQEQGPPPPGSGAGTTKRPRGDKGQKGRGTHQRGAKGQAGRGWKRPARFPISPSRKGLASPCQGRLTLVVWLRLAILDPSFWPSPRIPLHPLPFGQGCARAQKRANTGQGRTTTESRAHSAPGAGNLQILAGASQIQGKPPRPQARMSHLTRVQTGRCGPERPGRPGLNLG